MAAAKITQPLVYVFPDPAPVRDKKQGNRCGSQAQKPPGTQGRERKRRLRQLLMRKKKQRSAEKQGEQQKKTGKNSSLKHSVLLSGNF
jgi:hypothetical protein